MSQNDTPAALSDEMLATSGSEHKEGMSDLNYDLITCLAETLSAVAVLNSYIDDARQAGDEEAESTFVKIREDQLRHCEMLRQVIESRVKRGEFR